MIGLKIMKNTTVAGIVKRHPDGFGFLVADDPEIPDLYVSRKEMYGVMTNDRVEARAKTEKGGDRLYAINVKIVQRGTTKVVGTLKRQGHGDFLLAGAQERWGSPLVIEHKESMRAMEDQLVAVEITSYPSEGNDFRGRVVEILGDNKDPMNDIKKVLHLQNIPIEFSSKTLRETDRIPDVVTESDRKGRVDLRDQPFITIDGVTAKDFDDAILVQALGKRGFRLYVAIADVSSYVKIGTSIDDDAQERGTSVYLPNVCIPMLPEALSNEMCSLKPKVDRLAFVCEMDMDYQGTVKSKKVYEAVIKSHARVTYGEAQDFLNGDSTFELPEVAENITLASDLAKILMAKRYREGSLDLEVPETEVVVNDAGETVDIIKSERVFAHKLIEEMMLIANVSVAQLIQEKQAGCLYRIHEAPDPENIDKIQNFLSQFGSKQRLRGGHLQKKLTRSLQEFRGKPQGTVLNILTLRSMNQAKYSPDNIGHFGLGFSDYAHFTSPIRRYPDLIVHRVAKAFLTDSSAGLAYAENDLVTAGNMLSACEQRAVKAERMVISIKKARFMEDKVGESFAGVISSVAKFGVFVLLREFDVDGLVKVDSLGKDHFEFDEDNLQLTGKRSGQVLKIGDTVEILVAAVNTDEGKIDFVLSKDGEAIDTQSASSRDQKRSRKHHSSAKKKSSKKSSGKKKKKKKDKESRSDRVRKKAKKKKSFKKKKSDGKSISKDEEKKSTGGRFQLKTSYRGSSGGKSKKKRSKR